VPSFPNNVYLLALLGALVATGLSVPFWRALCQRWHWVDDPGHRKIHSTPIPLAGGWAIFTGLTFVLAGGCLAIAAQWIEPASLERLAYGLGKRAPQLIAILLGASGMLTLGTLDDRYELKAWVKFGIQFLIAFTVAAAGVRVTLFIPSVVFSYAATILWILTVTNALNLSDNMNGLCAGLAAIAAFYLASFAASHGQYLVAAFGFVLLGAMLGYLPFNFPRASVFLGDAGSHLVGFLIAVLSILPHFYAERHAATNRLAVLNPLLVLAIPLLDVAQVTLYRTLTGKPFWIGDTNHLSHRLARTRLGKTGAVVALWIAALAIGSLTFL
jgi:UDP-GlcNAc:undecaprenyl-phosphate GlcNAc-1-phosphate transferase